MPPARHRLRRDHKENPTQRRTPAAAIARQDTGGRPGLRRGGTGHGPPPGLADKFADAFARVVGEAEDAGLDPEQVLAEIEDVAQAMRECDD